MDRSTAAVRLMEWMESLADPTRLRLLRLLDRHELGVAELCDCLQLPQSTISRHLKVLAERGWVRPRRQGTNHLYRSIIEDLDEAARNLWGLARLQTESWPASRQDRMRLERLLREKQDKGQAFFAGAAGAWDRLRAELYGGSFTEAALLSLLPQHYIVADLGCGTGQTIARLAPHVAQVIGVDNSSAMLKAASHRLEGRSHVELRAGDLSDLPIDDSACDAALMILSLSYIPEPAIALREMSRILKAGGRAVLVDLLAHDREDFRRKMGQTIAGFEPDELQPLLRETGFASIRIQAISPEPAAKGPALFLATALKR